jgi:trans-aconitate 2-methyltransferase
MIDLGCGTGELTRHLVDRLNPELSLGIDNSEEMLKKARHFETPTLKFKKASISDFFGSEKFDLIFSNAAIQWCEDHPAIFKNIRNSLNPKGQIAVQMPMNHDYPTHILANQVAPKKFVRRYPLLSIEDYSKLLYNLGFKEQKVLLRVYVHLLESREGVIEWVQGTLLTHFQSQMPMKDYEIFFAEFKAKLFDQLPDEKPFFYPFKRVLLWGKL